MKYRKKETFEAYQMTKENVLNDRFDSRKWPEWIWEAWHTPKTEVGALFPTSEDKLMCADDSGLRLVQRTSTRIICFNDWILCGVYGLSVISDIEFRTLYEPVESEEE